MLVPDHHIARNDSSHESAPEHEARSAEERARVTHQDRVINLAAKESANHRRENEVANGFWIVTATRQLALRNDLRHHEGEQDREPEARELQRTDLVGEWLVNDGGEDFLHSKESRRPPFPG